MNESLLKKKIEYVFNKITLNFIKEVKDKDSEVKKKIKETYGIFDKYSDSHILKFIDAFYKTEANIKLLKIPYENTDIFQENSSVLSLNVLQNITVNEILSVVEQNEKEIVKCYLYMLFMFSFLYREVCLVLDTNATFEDESTESRDKIKSIELMFNKSILLIQNTETFDMNTDTDEIVDDDFKILLENIYHTKKNIQNINIHYDIDEYEKETIKNENNGFESAFDFLHNSKIGKLAKEISQDIDVTNLNIENPQDLLNMETLFSGKNNALSDIIGKVGGKITKKIQSGEIKQDELIQEAMSMMSKLNGDNSFMNDMMTNMMKNGMGGMGGMDGMDGMDGMNDIMKNVMGGEGNDNRKSKKLAKLRKRLEDKQNK